MKLKDVCEINMGQSPESEYYNDKAQGLPFFQGNADFGELYPSVRIWCSEPKKIAQIGDILMSVRAPIGAMNIANVVCCIGRGLASIKVRDTAYLKYIWYVLKSKVEKLQSKGTGSTFKAINKAVLEELEISFPFIEEQQRIADELDKVSGLIEKRQKQLEKLDLLIKSRFVEMFGDYDLHRISSDMTELSELGTIVGGSTPDTNEVSFWGGENLWITPAEISNEDFVINDTIRKITDEGANSCSLRLLPKNTVLLSSRAPIGKVAIVGKDMYCNQGFKNIICGPKLHCIYLYYLLKYNTEYLNSLGRGATFKEISKSIVEKIKVRVPEITQQNQFADFVEKVEQNKLKIKNSLDKLITLKKALMQKYFG